MGVIRHLQILFTMVQHSATDITTYRLNRIRGQFSEKNPFIFLSGKGSEIKLAKKAYIYQKKSYPLCPTPSPWLMHFLKFIILSKTEDDKAWDCRTLLRFIQIQCLPAFRGIALTHDVCD